MNSSNGRDAYGKNLEYLPKLVYNNYKEGKKVLNDIILELENCEEFIISVAFITEGGLTPLKQTLKELQDKNIPGKILTTDYLTFSDPKALDCLSNFKNIELKMYRTKNSDFGFHTKGYIFKKGDSHRIMVGSSNITQNALLINHEWNTKITTSDNNRYVDKVLDQFETLWNSKEAIDYENIKDVYREEYTEIKKTKLLDVDFTPDKGSNSEQKLMPNSMQLEFINNLKAIVDSGEKRALLISATGTGKTFASAFATRELGFKKVLFLAHRKEILTQAEKAYKKVFGSKITTGLLTGENKKTDCDFLFATVQTMSKENILIQFDKNCWDLIIIDEAHHSTNSTNQKILEYFDPNFYLGMTATPDKRTADENVYELFDYNIAHEIRLQQALEQDLLCPFYYFGIYDINVNNITMDDAKTFNKLTSDSRVQHVMEEAELYGFSGDRVKGLIFCSTVDEAKELSNKFNEKGWRTQALSGNDSPERRLEVIERLVMEDGNDKQALDYILTVDIFSEGVDIPEINQIIMLRPTESPIVFTQQLGRGLRKNDNKEYVVILDFIGNYDSNYMIPIALSGDRSYNKDNARQFVYNEGSTIPGLSTVHFDKISREKIYASIDKVKFSSPKMIRKNYNDLKIKLGRIPTIFDFELYGEMDVQIIFKEYGSYYHFLSKEEPDYNIHLNGIQESMISFISKEIANAKRIHELIVLDKLLSGKNKIISELKRELKNEYEIILDNITKQSVINFMTDKFKKQKLKSCVFIQPNMDDYGISDVFKEQLKDEQFRQMVSDLVLYGISRYNKLYSMLYSNTNLVLNEKYTRPDVARLLNWQKDKNWGNVGGYFHDEYTNTMPVFVTYNNEDSIYNTKYNNRFLDQQHIVVSSKVGSKLNTPPVQKLMNSQSYGIDIHLFVKKNNNDDIKEFYYFGKMTHKGLANELKVKDENNKDINIVEMEFELDTPVREDLYRYIVEE